MAAYCVVDDMAFGDIPISDELRGQTNPQKYVDDAADEIDSQIGFLYETPIPVSDPSVPRPVRLLLKRINAQLATGRFIMAVAGLTQDERLNAYGLSMVQEAQVAINLIATGETRLPGAPAANLPGSNTVSIPKVLQYTADTTSGVDAFYIRTQGLRISDAEYPPYMTGGA